MELTRKLIIDGFSYLLSALRMRCSIKGGVCGHSFTSYALITLLFDLLNIRQILYSWFVDR